MHFGPNYAVNRIIPVPHSKEGGYQTPIRVKDLFIPPLQGHCLFSTVYSTLFSGICYGGVSF